MVMACPGYEIFEARYVNTELANLAPLREGLEKLCVDFGRSNSSMGSLSQYLGSNPDIASCARARALCGFGFLI